MSEPEPRVVIWSIDHAMWWGVDERGYTPRVTEAGGYSDEDGRRILNRANVLGVHEVAIPVTALDIGGGNPIAPVVHLTPEAYRTAAVLDARTAFAAYRSLPTPELRELQRTHQGEQDRARTAEAIAWSAGRLALIAAVLKARDDYREEMEPAHV